jgi:hypothetical protein
LAEVSAEVVELSALLEALNGLKRRPARAAASRTPAATRKATATRKTPAKGSAAKRSSASS